MAKPRNATKVWDRFSIKAEIERRGMTLSGLATDAGMYRSACRQGLRGESRPGAQVIAGALGIPFDELFSKIYVYNSHHDDQTKDNARCMEGKKTEASGQTVEGC